MRQLQDIDRLRKAATDLFPQKLEQWFPIACRHDLDLPRP